MHSQQVVTKKQQAAKERKTEGLCINVALPDFSRTEQPAQQRDKNLVQAAGTEQGNTAVQMQC